MNISFNFTEKHGRIKPMHAVGQPPRLGISDEFMHYLTEAHIPYSRLHDMGGLYGGYLYVDIPNIFRDFSADENDPASYDFPFTDLLIKQMMAAGAEPIYRLGVTIENYQKIRAYRIDPPSDFGKWARICEHIVRHYNEGWADGFKYGIKYWEIWNEPDGNEPSTHENEMWTGTAEQYYELYDVAAKHLKKCFGNKIKVGGYASCGFYGIFENPSAYGLGEGSGTVSPRSKYFLDFFEGFLEHIHKSGAPIDFFSWHSYDSVVKTCVYADYVDRMLTKYGLGGIETQLNEWNNASPNELRGKSVASARAAAMMIAMQHKKTDILCYYDARIGTSCYGGLFNPMTYLPLCTYYSFKAFGELYALGEETGCEYEGNNEIYALAAAGENGGHAALITNVGDDCEITTNLSGMKAFLIDEEHLMTETDIDPAKFTLGRYQTVLFLG